MFLSILTVLLFSSVSSNLVDDHEVPESNLTRFDILTSDLSWNESDYINFTVSPIKIVDSVEWWYRILIDDEDPNYNWSITAANNSWCTGSGTYLDPYIIENLYINAGGFGGMICIRNSNKFFFIRNCWFDYSGRNEFDIGVLLMWAGNGTIDSNIFTYLHCGTNMMQLSYNNTVSNNVMISDHKTAGVGRGIELSCDNNTILNNKIRNFYSAIGVFRSLNVVVDGNYAENTIWSEGYQGIPIYASNCNHSTVVRNVLAGSFASGVFQLDEIDSSDNIIENNTVITDDLWVFGPETSGTTLSTPKLSQSDSGAITLSESHFNLIAHNIMLQESVDVNGGAIQGFDIFILMGMFGVISVLLAVVKRKKR